MAGTLLDVVTTLQDVVKAINVLTETWREGQPGGGNPLALVNTVTVSRGLLELALSIVQDVEAGVTPSQNELQLVERQLKAALGL